MKQSELKEFLKKKQIIKKEEYVDWEFQKNKWLEQVNELYKSIDSWLVDFVSDGILNIKRESILIDEESIGEYFIDKYIIKFDDYDIVLEPQGTLVIGAWGRIDFIGYLNKGIPLLLLPPHVKSTHDMVKVEIINTGAHLPECENSQYPVLEWKLFNENTRDLDKMTQELFYECIRNLSKDVN